MGEQRVFVARRAVAHDDIGLDDRRLGVPAKALGRRRFGHAVKGQQAFLHFGRPNAITASVAEDSQRRDAWLLSRIFGEAARSEIEALGNGYA